MYFNTLYLRNLTVFNSYDFKVNSVMQVHKDQKAPFFMSGCKVADGVGVMMVQYDNLRLFFVSSGFCRYIKNENC